MACGGLPERNRLLMQIYADVTARDSTVAASPQTPALGSAMFGAVAAGAAAGGYDSHHRRRGAHGAAARRALRARPGACGVYDELYADYRTLHDHFGRGGNDVMKRLRALRARALA